MKRKLLYFIAEFIRRHRFCQNICKFKIGDKITYNWRAKLLLSNKIDFNKVFEVSGYYEYGEGVETKCGDFISAHWMKKVSS